MFDLSKSGKEISSALMKYGIGVESIQKKQNSLEEFFFKPQGGAWLETSNEIRDKKYKLTKYIKGIFIATVCIIAFITVSLIDSMTDPKQTKDTYDSIIRMLNLLVTGTFVIFSSVLTAKYIIGEYKDRTILLMFTYPIKREKIILTKLAMVCSFTGISIAISYALCVVYVTIAEAIFDVTASTITLELIIYGIKEMIISVILGSVLSLFPYIIGMTKNQFRYLLLLEV